MPSCGLVQMENEGGLCYSGITPSQNGKWTCMSNLEGIGEMGIMTPKAEARLERGCQCHVYIIASNLNPMPNGTSRDGS